MSEASSRVSTEGVLNYLCSAESHESNPHYQTDYRIAWITVLKASRGEAEPHYWATYAVLRTAPDMVWKMIERERRAKLGALYEEFFGGASSPKKPLRTERNPNWRRRNAAA